MYCGKDIYEKFVINLHNNLQQAQSNQVNDIFDCNNVLNIVVAFSGGVDSTALLMLMKQYSDNLKSKFGKEVSYISSINLTAVTVNHNLRAESLNEAKKISVLCSSLGIKHQIINWEHDSSLSNIQSRARQARYSLISNFCTKNDIPVIATAHHMDDNFENFLIKVSRGSGISGLTRKEHLLINSSLSVVRPLYNISKEQITRYVKLMNLQWIEDSSNSSNKYTRNVIRKAVDRFFNDRDSILSTPKKFDTIKLPQQNINGNYDNNTHDNNIFIGRYNFGHRLLTTQKNLESVNEVYEYFCEESFKKHSIIFNSGFIILHNITNITFNAVWIFILKKCLIITRYGREKYCFNDNEIRSSSIESIVLGIKKVSEFVKTLYGCFVIKKDDMLLITRDFSRKVPRDVLCIKNNIWDDRFQIVENLNNGYVSYYDMYRFDYQKTYHEKSKDVVKNLVNDQFKQYDRNTQSTKHHDIINMSLKYHSYITHSLPLIVNTQGYCNIYDTFKSLTFLYYLINKY